MNQHAASSPDGSSSWKPVLFNSGEIASHVWTYSSDDIDVVFVEECFAGAGALLQRLPVDALRDGPAANNVPSSAKEARYLSLPLETMPPVLVENGVVSDGNHRLRVARARGATDILCYVVVNECDLPARPARLEPVPESHPVATASVQVRRPKM